MMPDYMEIPDFNAPTLEGKVQQMTEYLTRFQERYNRLVEKIEKERET